MLKQIKSKKEQGFTIIEVLIVLAIAGLILLVVFLAVPALQRNSRNTTYKNEASQLLSAATEFVSNNNGTTPVNNNKAAILALTKNKTITDLTVTGATTEQTPSLSAAVLVTGRKCGAANGDKYGTDQAGTRSLALIYGIENSSGTVVAQCIEG